MGSLSEKKWPFMAVAHRGYKALFSENTMISFNKAVEAGANMLECDVRLTKDSVPVIFHDTTLSRLAGTKKYLKSHTWDDLEKISLRDHRKDVIHLGKIPRLSEVLNTFKDKVSYYIELKSHSKAPLSINQTLCQAVIDEIKRCDLVDRCMIVSFSFPLLEMTHCLLDKIQIGYNFKRCCPDKEHLNRLKEMKGVLCPKHTLLSKKKFNDFKKMDFRVLPWVVNDEKRMKELIDWGVDGITTDHIKLLKDVAG